MAIAWIAYLSLMTIGQDFLGYQWDALLLETGFFGLFVAPMRWLDRARNAPQPMRAAVWLMLWLLFRLIVASGAVKLTSGDPTWTSLTALTFHFETQPLPTPIAWYVHHAPAWVLKVQCASVIGIELFAPLLMFGNRQLRIAGVALLVGLQAVIALTGNYAWFNLLSAALCVFMLDDAMLGYSPPDARRHLSARVAVVIAAAVTLPVSILAFAWSLGVQPPGSRPLVLLTRTVAPFHVANRYGLFAVMTTTRPEIIVEGSEDGQEWRPYEFRFKPGDLRRRPAVGRAASAAARLADVVRRAGRGRHRALVRAAPRSAARGVARCPPVARSRSFRGPSTAIRPRPPDALPLFEDWTCMVDG